MCVFKASLNDYLMHFCCSKDRKLEVGVYIYELGAIVLFTGTHNIHYVYFRRYIFYLLMFKITIITFCK